ncbi:PAS domain S-box protein [Rhodoferax saidenbachensis]|uniref:histidine kinase n=1 Tax=Rhodoferax saidenbachensis TaxID=1484693 RepID=A0A1P8K852_9BURK|nr:PAS domain S-box protein [Rhodoferax saidenbachensis]APW42162.1 PAS domain-containing sensor histidine kinase [Rhodoferax saidenbachensis]
MHPNNSQPPQNPSTLADTVRQLQARENHLEGLLGSAPDSILGMDTEGMVTDWNPGAERVLGWAREEAMGKRMSDLIIPAQYREAHEKGMRRFVQTGEARVLNRIIEIEAQHKDGRIFPIELSIWNISRELGGGFGASVRDVSERHRAQESLRTSEERYRSVVEHLGEGMFVAKANRIVFANRQASDILRIPNEDIIGSDPVDWIHPDDRAAVLELRANLAQGRTIATHYEARHVGRDGVERWLDIRPKPVFWEGGMATLTFFSEITESKQIQEALQRSEERYRAVIEHVDSGMVVLQGDRLVYANRRAAELTHMDPETILKVGFLHRVHPDDHKLIQERRNRRLAGEEVPSRYEVRLLFDDGSVRWIELGVSVVPWNGQPATITFFSDVTERKAMTQALHRSEERYRAVIEHSGEGMLVVQDARFVFANFRAAELLQMTREDLLREGYLHRIHPDDHAMVDDRRKRRLAGEEIPNRYEIRLLLPDNVVRWIDIGVTVVPWDGTPATLTFFSDITERKQGEADLQRTSSEREAILQSALVGIVLSVDRKHQWVNDKFAEMVDYTREELIGQSTLMVHSDRETWERWGEEQRAAMVSSGTYTNERPLKRRNGEILWVQMAGRCVRDRDPDSGIIWTFLDITERIKAEQSTRAALEQQKELNELRSRFVAMTSHEFRTPLATILSSAELLKYYGDRLPAADKAEVVQTIENSVHRMTRMLDRVLLLGKVDAQMLEFQPREIDLIPLCHALMDDARTQHPKTHCTLVSDFVDLPSVGLFDEKLLRHIFGNLLSNAIKYSPEGGEVRFRVTREDGQWVMEVSDQGIGIPAEEIPHLFESFHRASNVGDIQGTGLGLAIVKNSVDLHGGRIQVHSGTGKGTRFIVKV